MVESKTLHRFWTDRCDVYVKESKVDGATGRTVFTERKLHADVPCRVSFRMSFETVRAAQDVGDGATAATQAVKIFLAPDVTIPPGSKIVAHRKGTEFTFWKSGVPAVFEGHQEVRVERQERWT